MSRPQNSFLALPQPQKRTPKLSQTQMSELEENIENESCSTTSVDPKTVVEPYSDPQKSTLGPKKHKK